MDYTKFYNEAKTKADEIIAKVHDRTKPRERLQAPSGFAARKPLGSLAQEEGDGTDLSLMVAQYMSKLNEQEQQEQPKEPRDRRSGNSQGGSTPTKPKARPSTEPIEGDLGLAREALGQIESGGNYQARGPVVKKGRYKGERAVGKYQVMPGNLPQWTREALGEELSVEEFLADEKAQDAVVEYQLKKSYDKHGTWEDAASIWFSGRPLKGNNADDDYNSVPQYVSKFQNAMRTLT